MAGLYVHVPYCVRKCIYCDFYSVESSRDSIATRLASSAAPDANDFLNALEMELRSLPRDFRPETVFIGGGTPTELSEPDLDRLLQSLHNHLDLSRVTEWTCEANPGTLTRAKASLLLSAGVNRISLGIQSFHAPNLEFLGRIHSGEDATGAYDLLRGLGVRNINLDLAPEHTSGYCLTFEPDTPLFTLKQKGYVLEVDDDRARSQYHLLRQATTAAGYRQYEISNFARPGYECRHNLLYWSGGEFLGCGPSAHSYWKGVRRSNVPHIRRYCDALLNGKSAQIASEQLDPEGRARESLVMSLRRTDGVSRRDFIEDTGFDYYDLCRPAIESLQGHGLVSEGEGKLALTESGLFVSNAVFAELL